MVSADSFQSRVSVIKAPSFSLTPGQVISAFSY